MLNIDRIIQAAVQTKPFAWANIDALYTPENAVQLAATFPLDKFKRVAGYDGEKGYEYFSRSLIHMGADRPSFAEGLSPSWLELAHDLLSPEYRNAISRLTGQDLSTAPMEVNVIHYGPNCWLGPHLDLKEKIVTQILYFNQPWNREDGGYLQILGSADPADVSAEVLPLVGNSAVLVRSDKSWHAVARVAKGCQLSRRSVNVIFHAPGSISTMWPPGEKPELVDYRMQAAAVLPAPPAHGKPSRLARLLRSFGR